MVLAVTMVLGGAPLRAATQFMGIEPGVSTRAQVARVLGRDVKITDSLSEYTPTTFADVSRVLVQYRPGNDVVDRMEVYFTTVQSRESIVKALALGRPTSSAATPRLREFHGAPRLLAVNYAGAAAESGVVSVGYYNVESFNDVTARAASASPAISRPVPIADLPASMLLGSLPNTVPVKLYFNQSRGDNFTTATTEGQEAARMAQYREVRVEGYAFAGPLPGSVPLKMYYNSKRGDSFTTATAEGEQTALREGYQFGRIEAYVMPTHVANSTALKQFWSAARQDYFVTATAAGEADAHRAGYVFVRIEGWVLDVKPVP
jgi:hypothetical protein